MNSSPVTLRSLPSPCAHACPPPLAHARHRAGTRSAERLADAKLVPRETASCGSQSVLVSTQGFCSRRGRQCTPRRKCSPGEQDAGFPMMSRAHVPVLSVRHRLGGCSLLWAAPRLPPAALSTWQGGAPSGRCSRRFSQPRRLGGRFCLCLIKLCTFHQQTQYDPEMPRAAQRAS